jgi:acyl carrier protein
MDGQPVNNGRSGPRSGADIAHLLRTVLAERFRRPLKEITPDTRLVADLGVDSLDMIEIHVTLEERLHTSLPQVAMPDEVHVQTVQQLANLIAQRRAEG